MSASTACLDLARLEKVRTGKGKTVARCPACAESGGDKSGEHLCIDAQDRFCCVKNPGPEGVAHRKRIFALAGVVERSEPPPKSTKRKVRTWPDADAAAKACTPGGFALVAVYDYPRDGKPFAAVGRYENKSEKTFLQFSLNGNGWKTGGPAGLWPLYCPEALPANGVAYVVEGEKAHAAAASIGLPVVTSAGGSSGSRKTDWSTMQGHDVILLPDNDGGGAKYAKAVTEVLSALQCRVRVATLPGLPEGGDIADYLEAHDAAEPEALRAEIESLTTNAEANEPAGLDGAVLLRDDPPPHRPVLVGLFDCQSLVEIVGPSKTRKSFAVMQLALSLAAGRDVFGFETGNRLSVLVVDLELSEPDIHRRTSRMGRALGISPADIEDRLRILPLAGAENPRAAIEAAAEGFDILICDPLYALCDGAESIENFRDPLRWLRCMAVKRAACIFIHHDAKGAAGDRETRDRGSGSGITGRAVDARITLTPAAADPDNTVVMGFMCRSYVCPEPRAYTFAEDAFRPSDLPAEPERQSDRRARSNRPKLANYQEAAVRILYADGPMSSAVFKQRLREELNMSKGDSDTLTAVLCEPDGAARRWREGGFAPAYKIGTREQSARASRCLPGSRQEAGEAG